MTSKSADDVGRVILDQMGGAGRLRAMLGARMTLIPHGVQILWPNKQRTRGNMVEIILQSNDTYDMTFYNASSAGKKLVKKHDNVYFDQLIELFERQTGWFLRLASSKEGVDMTRKANRVVEHYERTHNPHKAFESAIAKQARSRLTIFTIPGPDDAPPVPNKPSTALAIREMKEKAREVSKLMKEYKIAWTDTEALSAKLVKAQSAMDNLEAEIKEVVNAHNLIADDYYATRLGLVYRSL